MTAFTNSKPVDQLSGHDATAIDHGQGDQSSNTLVATGCWQAIRRFRVTNVHKAEVRALVFLAIPMVLTNLLQFLIQSESIIMCGHLGKIELDAATLANSLINVLAVSILNGLLTACDTYFSQAFGMDQRKKIGMHFQRGLMIVYLLYLLVATVILNAERLLLLLGQDIEIAKKAAAYMIIVLPGIFCDFNFIILARFLQNQNIIIPPLVIAFNGNIFNVVSQYIAIYIYGYGFTASAVCQATSMLIMLAQMLIYIYWKKAFKSCWDGWTRQALYDWGAFMKLAIPGIGMLAMEEWIYEAATILAGFLGANQLGAQSILFQTSAIAYMVPMGLQVSVAIRVSHQIGDGNPMGARLTYRVGMFVIVAVASVMAIGVIALRKQICTIFTNDVDIISIAVTAFPVMVVYLYFDGLASVGYGVVRGCGRQLVGGFFILTGYYVVGIPIGVPLMLLTSLGVIGYWLGLLVGYAYVVIGVSIFIARLDWKKECDKARTRLNTASTVPIETRSETENDESAPLLQSVTRKRYSSRTGSITQPIDYIVSTSDPSKFTIYLIRRIIVCVIFVGMVATSALLRLYYPIDNVRSAMNNSVTVSP